ncbi:MAG: hypothetical protein WBB29_09325 [Geitlerinemataceae cyanobacterium]
MSAFPQIPKKLHILDRAALTAIVVLMVPILILVLGGDRTVPYIRDFSWQNRQVGAEDRSFILTFSRPMDRASVEENLQIDPPLPGKISWAGRRMAYTLDQPAPYGFEFEMKLANAQDRLSAAKKRETSIEPFGEKFSTRDRALVYISLNPSETGQLVLYNFTQDRTSVLTPADLRVMDYKIYPNGDRILFSAVERGSQNPGLGDVQLYTVTTGISPHVPGEDEPKPEPVGKIRRILDNKDYQNLKFDLSPDGRTIVVQRADRRNPGGSAGLWVIRDGEKPQPTPGKSGGTFLIAPNSEELAIAQGQGISILSIEDLKKDASKPLEFFPQYGNILNFTRDGSAAVMVKYNADYTRSLYLVPNQGDPQEILNTKGSILSAQFDSTGGILYCVLTDLIEGEIYKEVPYLAALNLESQKFQRLFEFKTPQPDITAHLSADGLSLIFDRLKTSNSREPTKGPRTSSGGTIVSGRLWLLLLAQTQSGEIDVSGEELPLVGFLPRWLP